MGADFISQTVPLSDGAIPLHIWDTAGQEQYQAIGPLFYRSAAVAVVVYAVVDDRPLDSVNAWIEKMRNTEANVKIVVFGNKVDLVGRPNTEVADWCQTHQTPHFFCSALTGDGVKDGFIGVAEILRAQRPRPPVRLSLSEPRSTCC
jgi:small GTP-binding protein